MDERVNLGDLVYLLVRNRRIIVISVLAAIVVSAAISLVLPSWYKAKAMILPPETATSQTDVVGIMRFAGYQPAMLPTLTSPSDLYAAILRSSTVTNAVIDSLDLLAVYGTSSRRRVIDRVTKHIDVSVTGEGLVKVQYEDRDRERSAEITNAFVRELDRFNQESRVSTARRVREFIEDRIGQAELELEEAETRLKHFKEDTGAVLISEQTEASIQTAAGLYGRIAELEVSLERMRQYATDRSPEVMDIKTQIRALERKLAEMGYMSSDKEQATTSKLFPSFSNAPELEMRLAELLRDVEIKRSVYKVLSEQYEEAKIQETRDTPTLQVLDWAYPPMVRSKPKRKAIVGVSAVAAFLLSSFVVFYRRRVNSGGGGESQSTLSEMGGMLRQDLRQVSDLFRQR
jgi:uncharacterized protein involved in exopolysaccharide biosynthesis